MVELGLRGSCQIRGLLVVIAHLFLASSAHADERRLSAEVASGFAVFGDGPTPYELGLSLDVGLSLVVGDYFVARGAVGLAPTFERHGPLLVATARLEGALRAKFGSLVPMLGVGGSVRQSSPAAHVLLGLGIQVAPTWQLGLDVRGGPFWDLDASRKGATPVGEVQFRMGWALR